MGKELLTDAKIRNLKPPQSVQAEIWDTKIPGFGVRLSAGGTKAFQLLYRINGRSKRRTLGRYPILGLSDARKLAQAWLGEVALGKDPAADKNKNGADPIEFGEFVRHFVEEYAKRHNKSWKDTERLINKEFVSHWRKRDIKQIGKADVTAILDAIVHRGSPSTANHAFAAIRKLFNWALDRGVIVVSPCLGLKAPSKIKSRDNVIEDKELKQIWLAAQDMDYPYGKIVQILILTGQRRGEVSAMRWCDIDFEKKTWSIPADQNKSGRPHTVPLTDGVIDILNSVPHTHEELLFPARGRDNPVSGFSKWKKKIEYLSEVGDWTVHDIRRTVSTGMAEADVAPHVIERVLNHSDGTISGVAAIYNRFGYLDKMRDALEIWGKHVKGLTN